MSAQKTRRVLSVFLASPGDVLRERNIAAEVVNRFNRLIGPKLGWQIDLLRWEDSKPAYGRPQSIINPSVDACDLFIGLLWERWGQPTGVSSSGFHEEFERAKTRRESSGEPEIWLVFKTPRSDKMEDPGSELTKVLEFREMQKSLGQVLFKEIKDSEDWNTSLYDWLIDHIWEPGASLTETAQQPPKESPSAIRTTGATSSDALVVAETPVPEVPEQLVELSSRVSRIVSSGNLEFSRTRANVLEEFDVVRLYLLSATWMADRYTSEFLGTHEINLLYKHRSRLEATSAEEYQILRTVLHDTSDVIPGWFWFRDAFPNGLAALLFSIANHDANTSLRVRALALLSSARIQTSPKLWPSLPLLDESQEVSVEAINYLGSVGDEAALSLIKQAAHGNESLLVSEAANQAKYRILIRIDPKRAFSELISSEQRPSPELVRTFRNVANTLRTEDLIKGAETPIPEIVTISIAELARRDALPLDLAERVREDSSIDVKQIALQIIINNRGKAELDRVRETLKSDPNPMMSLLTLSGRRNEVDLDSLALNYYRTLPPEQLLKEVKWLSLDAPIAYKALALDHFDKISDLIRNDIGTGFKRIREEYLDDVKSRLNLDSETTQQILEEIQKDKVDEFIRSQFTEAALSGLALNGRPSDVEIARKFLKDERQNTRFAAATIVSRFGDEHDVRTLLEISDEAWGELVDFAAMNAIRLSAQPHLLAIEMVQSDRRGRTDAGLRWLLDQDSAEVRNYFVGLLNDESESKRGQAAQYLARKLSRVGQDSGEVSVYFRGLLNDESESKRAQAVRYLSKKLGTAELEELLNEYPGNETYYYNVVTWLDRILYAPSSLKEMFTRDLNIEVGAMEK
jgi:HEAT repeat protein